MGCDIHLSVEYRQAINSAKKWTNVDRFSKNPYYEKENPDGEEEYNLESIWSDRDYGLFARLAGVRKYADEVKTISEPRGLPSDVSDVTKKMSDAWGSDGHNHSWLTFAELEDFQLSYAWDSYTMRDLLKRMEERLRDVAWIRKGEKLSAESKQDFRIVFWFDN